ncbi:MAG: RNA methyltransferase [Myxococcales bacterium]|nr:RNA methyltransferase [Myxococcales bacterium]
MSAVYLALVHGPVLDKHGRTVTTSITNLDLHDLGRLACAYDVRRVFIVNPIPGQQLLFERIAKHWRTGWGADYNDTRRVAFERLEPADDVEDAARAIEAAEGARPRWIVTSARDAGARRVSFASLRAEIEGEGAPVLLLLGTGWGLAPELMDRAEGVLAPIVGRTGYRHLSVRAAAAILLDRLLAPGS